MNRQLYMGGGIMNAVPREQYGFGSIFKGVKNVVKKATGAVKDIASSDIGKAALIAGTGYYLGGGQIPGLMKGSSSFGFLPQLKYGNAAGSGFGLSNILPNIFNSVGATGIAEKLGGAAVGEGFKLGTAGKFAALAGLTGFLTSTLGMSPEQAEEEVTRDPSKYLRLYYTNLNPPGDKDPEVYEQEVQNFISTNTSEYAQGGRIGYQDAGPVLPEDPTKPVNPFAPKPTGPVLPNKMMASNMENEKILEALFEKFLDMGLSPEKAAKEAKKEFERMSMMKTEGRGLAAIGGRMNYGMGSDDTMSSNEYFLGKEKYMKKKQMEDMFREYQEYLYKKEYGPRDEVAMGGRMNYALGDTASQNAMQAAGIEGLPMRQNPKGVQELDLRDNGGFIPPVGIKEKEDDIPAMLSNNEFVFTADAVRGMGDGDVELGAQRMYDQMKMLEKGGRA